MIIGDDYEDYDELLPKKELFYLKENLMDVIIVHHEIIKNWTMIIGDDYEDYDFFSIVIIMEYKLKSLS